MRLLPVILFLLPTIISNAQVNISLGEKGGLNLTKFADNINLTYPELPSTFKPRFHVGIYGLAKLERNPALALQLEILYSRLGNYAEDPSIKGLFSGYDLDYLTFPLMTKWYFFKGFNFQLGPQFLFLAQERNAGYDGASNSGWSAIEPEKRFQKFDMSLNAGLGWEAPFGILIDVRYCAGLFNIVHRIPPQTKMQSIQISLGVKLVTIKDKG